MTSPLIRRSPRHSSRCTSTRRGFTLLEMFLVLLISGILVAAIAAAINIHFRVSEVGRTEVEQAQLARALLRRIADDLRGAVPDVKPVESDAGSTAADIASAAASAAAGSSGAAGGSGSSPSGSSGGSSTGSSSTGGSSSGGSSSSSGSGAQTLQPLKALTTLKPQSASSSSGGSSSGASSSGGSGGSSGSGSSTTGKSSTSGSTESDTNEDAATPMKPPGIYGDQFSLQIDVSRLPRSGFAAAGIAALDAPGDVKTVDYYLAPIMTTAAASTSATTTGLPAMGLYRRSYDRAVASFDASAASGVAAEPQLLAAEVAMIEFRYFDGTAWQTSWDSSGGTLPTAVEIVMTLLPATTTAVTSMPILTAPQQYRLTVAIPAAQASSSSTSTDTSAESTTSSNSETSP